MIDKKALSFKVENTQGSNNFPDNFKGKWVIIFSHSADFMRLCTSEFRTFVFIQPQFETLNYKF